MIPNMVSLVNPITTQRFAARFRRIEQHAAETGCAVSGLSLEEMEAVWQAAKGEE